MEKIFDVYFNFSPHSSQNSILSELFTSLPQLEQKFGFSNERELFFNLSNLKVAFSSTVCSSRILQLSQNLVSTRRYFPQERHLNHNLRPQFLQNSSFNPKGSPHSLQNSFSEIFSPSIN